jgi:hypothetical protein
VVLLEELIVLEQSRRRLFVFVVVALVEAEGWLDGAGSKGDHQPRSTAAVACACASMLAGSRPQSRRYSSGRPHRYMLSLRVLRRTLSFHAEGNVHLNLHVQACVGTRSSHMSPGNSRTSFWPKDKNSLVSLVEYASMVRTLVVMLSCNIVVNNIRSQAAVVSWKMCDTRNPYCNEAIQCNKMNKVDTC